MTEEDVKTRRRGAHSQARHADSEAMKTSSRRPLLLPTPAQWVDLGLLSALCLLALYGLRATYGGWTYLIVAAIGLVLGIVLGHVSVALRQPVVAVIAAAVIVFFGLGGAVTLRSDAIGGVLPSVSTLRGLSHVSVYGWKDLLTTLPPVGSTGSLLVIPYLLGLLGGVVGSSLVERTRSTLAALAVPLVLLVLVFLLGTSRATSLPLQGGLFAVLALVWAAMRSRRQRTTVRSGSGRRTRVITATAMLAVAGAVALVAGPQLPGTDSHRRVVLRDYIAPPFDVGQYPSPLAAMRKYTKGGALHDTELLSVTGLAAGTPIKIATLDTYDGAVWAAANAVSTDGQTSTFQRIGETVDPPVNGTREKATVRIGVGYHDVWVPSAGELARVRFAGGEAELAAFRYNVATSTGVYPAGLVSGDTYQLDVVVPAAPANHPVAFGAALVADSQTSFTRAAITQWAAGETDPWDQAVAVAKHLRTVGKYSDGTSGQSQYLPGHGLGRLTAFLAAAQLVGNDEQYAAIYALMVNQIGLPARVVLGALPEGDGTVKGSDVHAWVEVHVADGSGDGRWLTVPTSSFTPDTSQTPDNAPPQTQQDAQGKVVPPPNSVKPPTTAENPDQPQANITRRTDTQKNTIFGVHVPGLLYRILVWGGPPVLVVLLIAAAIVVTKQIRRRRRRSRGSPGQRLAAGWREVLDHARDLGRPTLALGTRREQADVLQAPTADQLARSADEGVFGPVAPDEQYVDAYWHDVGTTRRTMSQSVSRWRRLRAAVSIRSLRRDRVVSS